MKQHNFIFLFFILLTILLLFMPIKLRCKIDYDVFRNDGLLSLFLFKIKLLLAKLKFKNFTILLKDKKKTTTIYLFNGQEQSKFGDIFLENLLQNIKVDNSRFISKFGIMRDCLLSSIICGIMINISSVFGCLIAQKKENVKLSVYCMPDYLHNTFVMCFTSSITFNLFVLLKCLIISTIKICFKRRYKNGN